MTLLNSAGPSRSPGKSKTPRASKPLKWILGVGALAGVIALGSSLAANIALNTGAPIEFGQGVAQTTACDGNVVLTPISTFVNAEGAGGFKFTAVTLSGLDTTDQTGPSEGCAGKTFTIKIYDDLGALNENIYLITVGSSAFTSADGTFSVPVGFDSSETSATLTFDPVAIAATDVYRITIESAVTSSTAVIAMLSPRITTDAQIFSFNPSLFKIPLLNPDTPVCTESENPGWIKLRSPNVNSLISIYLTDGIGDLDTTLKIFDTAGNFLADNDDYSNEPRGPSAVATDTYALTVLDTGSHGYYSALTFDAVANTTYYVGIDSCDEAMPSADLDIGYYYSLFA